MKRILGSIIGATLLCALPVSPHLVNGGVVSFGIERARAADLDIDRKAPRHARRHVEHVAVAEPVDPRTLAYCSGPYTGGGWNGGTYHGGIFMDLNCYGYITGDPNNRGWGLGGPFLWW